MTVLCHPPGPDCATGVIRTAARACTCRLVGLFVDLDSDRPFRNANCILHVTKPGFLVSDRRSYLKGRIAHAAFSLLSGLGHMPEHFHRSGRGYSCPYPAMRHVMRHSRGPTKRMALGELASCDSSWVGNWRARRFAVSSGAQPASCKALNTSQKAAMGISSGKRPNQES